MITFIMTFYIHSKTFIHYKRTKTLFYELASLFQKKLTPSSALVAGHRVCRARRGQTSVWTSHRLPCGRGHPARAPYTLVSYGRSRRTRRKLPPLLLAPPAARSAASNSFPRLRRLSQSAFPHCAALPRAPPSAYSRGISYRAPPMINNILCQ